MKIALLTEGIFPYVIGGMQRHSTLMAKYLARRRVRITVYHFIEANREVQIDDIFSADELENISLVEIPYIKKKYFPGHYFAELLEYSKTLFEQLDQNQFDFIYVQGYAGLYPFKKNLFRKPTGINFHGAEFFQKAASFKHKLSNIPLRFFANYCFKNADVIFSLGGKLNELYKSNGFSEKLKEMPIGIEGSIISPDINISNSPFTFLFVGRYEERKGIDQLNEAISKICRKGVEFNMEFVGPIPQNKRALQDNVLYHGQVVDASKLNNIYKRADFLILPSTSEGMPTVILEAMARGCAIIATNVGAVANMVDQSNGYLIDDNFPTTLVSAMERAIGEEPTFINTLKEASLSKVKKYTWEKVSKRTEELIKRIVADGKS